MSATKCSQYLSRCISRYFIFGVSDNVFTVASRKPFGRACSLYMENMNSETTGKIFAT